MTATTADGHINGVDVATLFATLDAVKGQNEIAKFQFRASNEWQGGTHSRSSFSSFYGAGQELEHKQVTVVDSDHPAGNAATMPKETLATIATITIPTLRHRCRFLPRLCLK